MREEVLWGGAGNGPHSLLQIMLMCMVIVCVCVCVDRLGVLRKDFGGYEVRSGDGR